jgi:hypothetical protein
MNRALLAIAVVAFGASCKGSDKDKYSNNGPIGGGARDALIDAWKKGGLDASAFAPAQTSVGKDCASGTVNKVEVLVCTFDTPDAAKAAQDLGLQWVGDTTGMSRAKGSLVIAVADRHKSDPNGKTINQIFKLVPN